MFPDVSACLIYGDCYMIARNQSRGDMKTRITKRTVDGLVPSIRDDFLWDTDIKGFGVKVTPKGKRIYICQYRINNRLRRYTIGQHGSPWTPEEARQKARRIMGMVAEGNDPARAKHAAKTDLTVNELCEKYLIEGCATKKASTIATDIGRINRHIKPLLGRLMVNEVTSNDIRRFQNDVAKGKTAVDEKMGPRARARVTGGKGTAARTVSLLGGIFTFAQQEGLVRDNPVRGVKKFPDKRNERFLLADELSRLGDTLCLMEAEGENPYAIAGIRLLVLTGCRKTEILSLCWNEVNFELGCLMLKDSKTGQKIVQIGKPALDILSKLRRVEGNDFVLPSMKTRGHFVGLPKTWLRVRKRAGLNDVRLHDLRHSFASIGTASGLGLTILGKLLGHKTTNTTARYTHMADDPLRKAADKISGEIAGLLEEGNLKK